jgi:hypothetical protein
VVLEQLRRKEGQEGDGSSVERPQKIMESSFMSRRQEQWSWGHSPSW